MTQDPPARGVRAPDRLGGFDDTSPGAPGGDMRRPDEGYALAVRAAGDGIWEWDLAADTLHLSERCLGA